MIQYSLMGKLWKHLRNCKKDRQQSFRLEYKTRFGPVGTIWRIREGTLKQELHIFWAFKLSAILWKFVARNWHPELASHWHPEMAENFPLKKFSEIFVFRNFLIRKRVIRFEFWTFKRFGREMVICIYFAYIFTPISFYTKFLIFSEISIKIYKIGVKIV